MKKMTLSKAKKRAWKAFSHWYRKKNMDEQGYVYCYTCDKRLFYKDADVGHWIEGHSNAVYINEDYVRVQCKSCNIFHGGRQGDFRDRIRKELGDLKVDQLIKEAHRIKKLTIQDYLDLEEKYERLS